MANPNRDVLLALADRCEREEPNWGLSVAIELAITPGVVATISRNPFRVRREADDVSYNPPPYTTSIDAAVALVPEHHSYELTFSAVPEGGLRRARLWDWRRPATGFDPDNEWSGHSNTL